MILETKKAPIGVFDSGVGGLTAVRCLRRLLPGEDVVFFGDTARVPYGSRTPEEIHRFARENLDFLRLFGAKAVLAACGTVSAIALGDLQDAGIPVCGVLLPAVEQAVKVTRSGRVGVIATPASIGSGGFQRALEERGCAVTANACPQYVPLAEQGRVRRGDPLVEEVTAEYLAPMKEAGVDTLILGCTHYPLFREVIAACLGEGVTLVDSSAAAAEALAALLGPGESREGGKLEIWVSGDPEPFTPLAERFLQETDLEVRKAYQ
jgi:glutamate racemase